MNIEAEAKKLLLENRRETDGQQYTIPSADHYPYQWLWDSCFHAIILAKYEPEAAKAEIKALLSKQFESGLLPHIIYWTPGILHLFRWGVEGTSSLTQPPMIAYAVLEIHRRDADTSFLRAVFPSLVSYYRYLLTERDPHEHHLASIINPDESGEDNSPRFDVPLGVGSDVSLKDHLAKRTELVDRNRECNFDAKTCMREFFWVKDVLFNVVLIENLRALSKIAAYLKHAEYERTFVRDAVAVANAMREHMFAEGVYWSTMGSDFRMLKVATWTHFVPLFAGLYTPLEAEAVVREHLSNAETFSAPFGIRTTSKQEAAYRSHVDDFSWRGPVWMAVHWFIYRGLMRYKFEREAADIRTKSLALLERSGFRECFNPETGEGYGAHNFTWGALALDMME
jgi:glycogen debranching enzyme